MTAVRKSVNVPLTPHEAFDLFTTGIDGWWPKERHSLSAREGRPAQRMQIDLRKGGELTETNADGENTRLGTVVRFEAGKSLTILWEMDRDGGEVTVAFTPSDTGTTVELTHQKIQIVSAIYHGPIWQATLGCFLSKAALRIPV